MDKCMNKDWKHPQTKPLIDGVARLTRQQIRRSLFEQAFETLTYNDPSVPHNVRRKQAREAANARFRVRSKLV